MNADRVWPGVVPHPHGLRLIIISGWRYKINNNNSNKKMKAKNYISAPLPFMGQKRRFIKDFKKVLEDYPADVTIVDLFGGSGLLSHVAKREKPAATVIYNDYDDYHRRIEAIPRTNALLERIRTITSPLPDGKMIPQPYRNQIQKLIADEEQRGFVDYITLSSSLLFSMKYTNSLEELSKETFYNNVRKSGYDATGYLDGLTIVRQDYKSLFNAYRATPGALFLVDPPYLSTEVGTYTMTWRLADYLDVLTVLQGHDFIYFTSNKSQILELCEWIGCCHISRNPFENAHRVDVNTTLNHTSRYTDIMLYKRQGGHEHVLLPVG